MRQPRYGELSVIENMEAAAIWRTRFDEPEPVDVSALPWWCDRGDQVASPEQLIEAKKEYSALLDLIKADMPLRMQQVLLSRFEADMTRTEVGQAFDLSPERVRQIEVKALLWVRRLLDPQLLDRASSMPPFGENRHPIRMLDDESAAHKDMVSWSGRHGGRWPVRLHRSNNPVIWIEPLPHGGRRHVDVSIESSRIDWTRLDYTREYVFRQAQMATLKNERTTP